MSARLVYLRLELKRKHVKSFPHLCRGNRAVTLAGTIALLSAKDAVWGNIGRRITVRGSAS